MGKVTPKNSPEYYARLNQLAYQEEGAASIKKDLKAQVLEEKTIMSWKIMLVRKNSENCLVFRGSDNVANWVWNCHFVNENMPLSINQNERRLISQLSSQIKKWKKIHGDISIFTGHSSGGYLARRAEEGSDATVITYNALLPQTGQNRLNFRNENDILTRIFGKKHSVLLGSGGHSIDDVVKNSKGKSWKDLGQGGSSPFLMKVLGFAKQNVGRYAAALMDTVVHKSPLQGRLLYKSAKKQAQSYLDPANQRESGVLRNIGLYFTDIRLRTPSSRYEEIFRLNQQINRLGDLKFTLSQTDGNLERIEVPVLSAAVKEIKSKGETINRYSKGNKILNFMEGVVPGLSSLTSIITGWLTNKAQKKEDKIQKILNRLEEQHGNVITLRQKNTEIAYKADSFTDQMATRMNDLCMGLLDDPEASTKEKLSVYEFLTTQREQASQYLSKEQMSAQQRVNECSNRLREAQNREAQNKSKRSKSKRLRRQVPLATNTIQAKQNLVDAQLNLDQLQLQVASNGQELQRLAEKYSKEKELGAMRETSAEYAQLTLTQFIGPSASQQKALAERNQADRAFREAVDFEAAIIYRLYQNIVNVAATLGEIKFVREWMDSKNHPGDPSKIARYIAKSGSLLLFYNAGSIIRELYKKYKTFNPHSSGTGVALMEVYFPIIECLTMVTQGILNWKSPPKSSSAIDQQKNPIELYSELQSDLLGLRKEIENQIHDVQNSVLSQICRDKNRAIITKLKRKISYLHEKKHAWIAGEDINTSMNKYLSKLRGIFGIIHDDIYNAFEVVQNDTVELSVDVDLLHYYPELFTGLIGKEHGQTVPNAAIYRKILEVLERMLEGARGRNLDATAKTQLREVRAYMNAAITSLNYFSTHLEVPLQRLVDVMKRNYLIKTPKFELSPISRTSLVASSKFSIYKQYVCDLAGGVLDPKIVTQALYPSRFMLWGLQKHQATEEEIHKNSLSKLRQVANEEVDHQNACFLYIGIDLKTRSLQLVTKGAALITCTFVQGRLFLYSKYTEKLQKAPFDAISITGKYDFKDYDLQVHNLILSYQKFVNGSDEEVFRSIKDQCALIRSEKLDGAPLAFPTQFLNHVKEKIDSDSFWFDLGCSEPYYQFSSDSGTLKLFWSGYEIVVAKFDPATIAAFRKSPLDPEINETEFLIQAFYSGFASKGKIKLGLPRGKSLALSPGGKNKDKVYVASSEGEFEGLYQRWVSNPRCCINYNSERREVEESMSEPLSECKRFSEESKHIKFYELSKDCKKEFYIALAWIKFAGNLHNPEHFLASECDNLFQPGLNTDEWKRQVASKIELKGYLAYLQQKTNQLLGMIDVHLEPQVNNN